MRRRTRIDLGQEVSSTKEEQILDRKRQRWADRNKDRPEETNPFLKAIKPDQEHFGDADERGEELRDRLNNLEYGNFPGYFNYRNKVAASTAETDRTTTKDCNKSPTGQDGLDGPLERPLESGLSDERLECLKKEWFDGKYVLDVGCNRGHITYAIARLFSPKSIVGIDIDLKMVNMANRDLHLHLEDGIINKSLEFRRERASKLRLEGGSTGLSPLSSYSEDPNQFPLASYVAHGPLSLSSPSTTVSTKAQQTTIDCDDNNKTEITNDSLVQQTENGGDATDRLLYKFPNNIVFLEHNYVLAKDELVDKQEAHFDTIVCLSVTKWIHLNYRDSGLKRFFRRIYKHLKPDGLLVLEAQPFDNYGRRKKLSDRLRANYYSIQFKPDEFGAYLLSEQVGFRRIVYESVTEHKCLGFKRPLKVFQK